MLRALRQRLQHRLRQLWEQCDLFETGVFTAAPPLRRSLPRQRPPVAPPRRRAKGKTRAPRVPKTHPQDVPWVARLTEAYHRYNAELFDNSLTPVMIRISRRMQNRLGHYMAATPTGLPAEIAISRRHIRRDTWDEVLHTLLHEMVHQWQDANGYPIDHGARFRAKARAVGISARATRKIDII